MTSTRDENRLTRRTRERENPLLWIIGLWTLPVMGISLWILPGMPISRMVVWAVAVLLAAVPVLVYARRQRIQMLTSTERAEEQAAQLKLQLEAVRFRTARLREELQAADRQARLSHQLTLLGRFTAGFMHEFNNPLAIVAGRLEVLLEERKVDADLCSDPRKRMPTLSQYELQC